MDDGSADVLATLFDSESGMSVVLVSRTESEWCCDVSNPARVLRRVKFVKSLRLNRREIEFHVTVDSKEEPEVIVLVMPTGRCAWRMPMSDKSFQQRACQTLEDALGCAAEHLVISEN
jgi:hypothetical protein